MVSRALVVQHCPEIGRAVSESLADTGLEPLVVADGDAALTAVAAWAPDVVLVDLTQPLLDGWIVLAAIGAMEHGPLVVVRIGEPGDVERAVWLGADAWVDDDVHIVAVAGRLALANAA